MEGGVRNIDAEMQLSKCWLSFPAAWVWLWVVLFAGPRFGFLRIDLLLGFLYKVLLLSSLVQLHQVQINLRL